MKLNIKQWTLKLEIVLFVERREPAPPTPAPAMTAIEMARALVRKPSNAVPLHSLN